MGFLVFIIVAYFFINIIIACSNTDMPKKEQFSVFSLVSRERVTKNKFVVIGGAMAIIDFIVLVLFGLLLMLFGLTKELIEELKNYRNIEK